MAAIGWGIVGMQQSTIAREIAASSGKAPHLSAGARLSQYLSLVKFSHSVFALPFALSMAVVCFARLAFSWSQLAIELSAIVVAMVAARTAAMAFNRLVDRHYDRENPRTAAREIPSGVIGVGKVRLLVMLSSAVFVAAAAVLGTHCVVMAPAVLGWLFVYSYCKRFTPYAHLVLGVALGLAPGAVWYALMGSVDWQPVPLMLAVTLWVAGFDIIYACQDFDFDRAAGLHSIPQRLGVASALRLARVFHVVALGFFALFGLVFELNWIFWSGFLVFAFLIASQHRMVSSTDLSRADAAFFTRNGYAAIVFFCSVLFSVLLSVPFSAVGFF